MFYLIGLGLGHPDDISVRGRKIVETAAVVYLEEYTSVLCESPDRLKEVFGREVLLADRDTVEQGCDVMLKTAESQDVVLLVVGDPLSATTHTDIILRAKRRGVPVEVLHNASIITAVACCGLQLYRFGETASIPLWTEDWRPFSFTEKIVANRGRGLHTLALLDIKMKERSIENIVRGRDIFEPPRFMTAAEGAQQMMEAEPASVDWLVTAVCRCGWPDQRIYTCTMKEMCDKDLGRPLHSLAIPSETFHPLEAAMLLSFEVSEEARIHLTTVAGSDD